MKRFALFAVIAAVASTGCGGDKAYDLADVSGQVLLDGQPLANARVLFRPVADSAKSELGPDAFGTTDAQGNFTLRTIFDETGAAVGRNQVSITTLEVQENLADPDNARARQVVNAEKVPPQYNRNSELYFEVQEEKEQEALFQLQSR
jgi:hypothetical protein